MFFRSITPRFFPLLVRMASTTAAAASTTSSPSTLRVALIQLAVTADKEANLANARNKILAAAKNGAELVVLPECFNCPYGNTYFPQYAEPFPPSSTPSPTFQMLSNTAKEAGISIIGGSFPEKGGEEGEEKGKLFNTSATFNGGGELIGKHRKMHLFDIDVKGGIRFKESETLTAGNSLTVFDVKNFRIGVGICYDVRFAELAQLYRHQYQCHMLVYPGAFNMTTGPKHWELLMRGRANDNQVYVCACSPARDTSSSYVAYGHSMVVNPWGQVVSEAQEGEETIFADLSLEEVDGVRQQIPTSFQRRTDVYKLTHEKQ